MRSVTWDRSSVIAALVGLVFVLLLTFAAGYFTGLHSALADEARDPDPPPLTSEAPTRVSSLDRPPASGPPVSDPATGPLPPTEVSEFGTGPVDDAEFGIEPDDFDPEVGPAAADIAVGEGQFTVQLGAFRDAAHARALASELERAHGVTAEVASQSDPDLGVLHKIWAGRFDTAAAAEEEAGRLRELTGREAWPVRILR